MYDDEDLSGKELSSDYFCECGEKLQPDWKFCPNCRKELSEKNNRENNDKAKSKFD